MPILISILQSLYGEQKMGDNTTAATAAINARVRKLADVIKPTLVVKGDVVVAPDDAYAKLLGEGDPTMEQVAAVHEHREITRHAFRLAAGEASVDAMAKDKDIAATTAKLKVGRDEIMVQTRREYQHRARPADPSSEMVTVHGQTTEGYSSGGGSTAESRGIRDSVRSYAANAFANLK